MKNTRVKKIITKKGKVLFYLGDGLWFGRINKIKAEAGLSDGSYSLWETVNKWTEQYIA